MARRIILLIACLCSIFMLAASASAYGEGTIRVSLDPGDMAAIGGEVTVYYVGVPLEDGYRITEEFGGGMVRGEDAPANVKALLLSLHGLAVSSKKS